MTLLTRRILQVIGFLGLALSFFPALLVLRGIITKEVYLNLMFVGMLLWFSTGVFWIKPEHLNK